MGNAHRLLLASSLLWLCSCTIEFSIDDSDLGTPGESAADTNTSWESDSGSDTSWESDSDTNPQTTSDSGADTGTGSEEVMDTDLCPNDPAKTEPGICGCGTPDADDDNDGTANCTDGCPSDPNKTSPGECGCNVAEGTCSPGATISMSKSTYAVDEEIVVSYSGLPGNSTDWIGLYVAGTADNAELDWKFTDGKVSGNMKFKGRKAGKYDARLFFNDSYNLEAKVAFTVK